MRAIWHRAGLLSVSVILLLAAGPVRAEEPAEPPPAPAPAQAGPSEGGDAASEGGTEPSAPATDAAPARPERLKEIVVTASRTAEPGFDAPYSLEIITEDEIRDQSYRTPNDALRAVPGVMAQKTSAGQGSPFIRGFTGYHNVYLVDGIRLNNSVFRSGPNQYWNTVDPLSVSRYEIVKGPGSVLYGSDAVGGVLNAITKGPVEYGEGFHSGGRLSYRISSAESSQIGRAEAYATWDHRLGIYVGGSIREFGDLEGGRNVGRQHETGYDEWDGDFKAEYFINPDTRIVVAHQTVRQNDVPRTHRTVYSTTWEGLTAGTELRHDLDQERDLTYVQLHAENLKGWIDALHLSLSWQEQDETRRRLRTANRHDTEGFSVGTLGASVQLESPSPVGRLVYGVEHYHDNVNSFSTSNAIQGPVADEAGYGLTGLFLQDTIPVAEVFDLTLGGRYEHARARADQVRDPITLLRTKVRGEWDSFVASARGVYHVDKARHWNVFGGVSQGFRAPNLSDLTRFDIARTGEQEIPSPDLEPEHFLSYEMGAKAEYKDLALQASYFYTVIEDLIVRQPTGRIVGGLTEVAKRNAGQGFVHGVELGGRWRFHPQWTAFGGFTWMDGEVEAYPTAANAKRREPLSRLMPTTTNVGFRWDHPRGKLWAEVTGTFAGEQDNLTTEDRTDTSRIPPGGTPGYAVLCLRTGYRVTEKMDVTFAIENVTNEDYRVHGSGLNEPGRNFILGLDMRF